MVRFWRTAQRRVCFQKTNNGTTNKWQGFVYLFQEGFVSRTRRKPGFVSKKRRNTILVSRKENGSFLNRRTPLLERKKKNRSKTRAACFKNRSSFLFFSFLFFSFLFFSFLLLVSRTAQRKAVRVSSFLEEFKKKGCLFQEPLVSRTQRKWFVSEQHLFLNEPQEKNRSSFLLLLCFALLRRIQRKEGLSFLVLLFKKRRPGFVSRKRRNTN